MNIACVVIRKPNARECQGFGSLACAASERMVLCVDVASPLKTTSYKERKVSIHSINVVFLFFVWFLKDEKISFKLHIY